jgi:hypothetical protein
VNLISSTLVALGLFAAVGYALYLLNAATTRQPVDPSVPLDREAAEDAAYQRLGPSLDPDDPEAGLTPFEVASRRYARYAIMMDAQARWRADAAQRAAREQALRQDIHAWDADTPDRSGFA